MTDRIGPRRSAVAGAVALAALAGVTTFEVAAAGAAGGGQVLHTNADAHGKMRFTASRLHAHPGRVTLVMHNPKTSGMPHGIAIEGRHVDKDGKIVPPGGTSRITVTLRKGTYEFYCPVPGHKQAGMEGKLVVG